MKLPQVTPKEIVKLLQQKGFAVMRQSGSHVRLGNNFGNKVTIAIHGKTIAKGTLMSILKQAGMTKEEFFAE